MRDEPKEPSGQMCNQAEYRVNNAGGSSMKQLQRGPKGDGGWGEQVMIGLPGPCKDFDLNSD